VVDVVIAVVVVCIAVVVIVVVDAFGVVAFGDCVTLLPKVFMLLVVLLPSQLLVAFVVFLATC